MSLSNDYTKQPGIQDFSVLPIEQKQPSIKKTTDETNGSQIILQSLEDLGETHRSLAGRGSLNPVHTKPSIEAQKALGVHQDNSGGSKLEDGSDIVESDPSILTPEQQRKQEILRMLAESEMEEADLNAEIEEIDSDLEGMESTETQIDSDNEEIQIDEERNMRELDQGREEVSQIQGEIQALNQAISEGEVQLRANKDSRSETMREVNSAMEVNRLLEAEHNYDKRALELANADIAHLQKFGLNYAVMVGPNGMCHKPNEPRNMADINDLRRNVDFMLMWNDKGKVVGGKKAVALLPDVFDMPTPHGAVVRMHKSDIIVRSDEEQTAFEEGFVQFIIKYAQQRGLDKAEKEKEPEKAKEPERQDEPHRRTEPEKPEVRAPIGDEDIRLDQEKSLHERAHKQEVHFRQKIMEQNRAYHDKRDAIIEEERRKAENA